MARTKLEARDVKPADAGTIHWTFIGMYVLVVHVLAAKYTEALSSSNFYLFVQRADKCATQARAIIIDASFTRGSRIGLSRPMILP